METIAVRSMSNLPGLDSQTPSRRQSAEQILSTTEPSTAPKDPGVLQKQKKVSTGVLPMRGITSSSSVFSQDSTTTFTEDDSVVIDDLANERLELLNADGFTLEENLRGNSSGPTGRQRTGHGGVRSLLQPRLSTAPSVSSMSGDNEERRGSGASLSSVKSNIYEQVPLYMLGGVQPGTQLPSSCFSRISITDANDDDELKKTYKGLLKKRTVQVLSGSKEAFGNQFRRFYGYIHEGAEKRWGIRSGDAIASYYHPTIHMYTPLSPSQSSFETHRAFTPSLSLPADYWPSYCQEWKFVRQRRATCDPTNPEGKRFIWPTAEAIDDIGQAALCRIIPRRIRRRQGTKKTSELVVMRTQWAISYAVVEDRLMMNLGHAHIKVLLFLYLLTKRHLVSQHPDDIKYFLRNLLFWMVENNAGDWPQEELGRKVYQMLSAFNSILKGENKYQRWGMHYIQTSRDAGRHLTFEEKLRLQHDLAAILEETEHSPRKVMQRRLLFAAISSLKCLSHSPEFYSRFDYESLSEILQSRFEQLIKFRAPIPMHIPETKPSSSKTTPQHRVEEQKDREQEILKNALRDMMMKRPSSSAQIQESQTPEYEEMKVVELSNLHWSFILPLFIRHFIALAQESREKFDAPEQSVMFLTQADNLAILLSSEGLNDVEEANEYRLQIQRLKNDIIENNLAHIARQRHGNRLRRTQTTRASRITIQKDRQQIPRIRNTSETSRESYSPLTAAKKKKSGPKKPRESKGKPQRNGGVPNKAGKRSKVEHINTNTIAVEVYNPPLPDDSLAKLPPRDYDKDQSTPL